MYEQFYGLTERPFDLTPNWRYLYLTPTHREALTAIQYGISARRGIVMVLGEAGTGKTTIVRSAIHAMQRADVRHVALTNPMLTRAEFLKFLSQAFELSPAAADCKVDLIRELTRQLEEQHALGRATVLVVDEAQSMPHELLEEIRLLANIETPSAKLLQVVLLGQPELADRLNDPSLRQLKQRVAIRCQLRPLDMTATSALIAGRIRVAGGKPAELFTTHAIGRVYMHSAGVPRTINVICDNALLSGFAADQRPIDADLIEEVCREFDFPALVQLEPAPAAARSSAVQAPAPAAPDAAGPVPPAAAPATPPSTAEAADTDMFSAYEKPRRFSLLTWVRG